MIYCLIPTIKPLTLKLKVNHKDVVQSTLLELWAIISYYTYHIRQNSILTKMVKQLPTCVLLDVPTYASWYTTIHSRNWTRRNKKAKEDLHNFEYLEKKFAMLLYSCNPFTHIQAVKIHIHWYLMDPSSRSVIMQMHPAILYCKRYLHSGSIHITHEQCIHYSTALTSTRSVKLLPIHYKAWLELLPFINQYSVACACSTNHHECIQLLAFLPPFHESIY
jgi:hypothetical protein